MFEWVIEGASADLISAAALPLRADAPLVYVAGVPFIESEAFC